MVRPGIGQSKSASEYPELRGRPDGDRLGSTWSFPKLHAGSIRGRDDLDRIGRQAGLTQALSPQTPDG